MLAGPTWLDASNDIGSPCYRFLGVGCSLLACEALEDDASVGADLKIGDGVVVATSSW